MRPVLLLSFLKPNTPLYTYRRAAFCLGCIEITRIDINRWGGDEVIVTSKQHAQAKKAEKHRKKEDKEPEKAAST